MWGRFLCLQNCLLNRLLRSVKCCYPQKLLAKLTWHILQIVWHYWMSSFFVWRRRDGHGFHRPKLAEICWFCLHVRRSYSDPEKASQTNFMVIPWHNAINTDCRCGSAKLIYFIFKQIAGNELWTLNSRILSVTTCQNEPYTQHDLSTFVLKQSPWP